MVNLEPKPDNEFEKQGVEFKIITEDIFEDVKTFMWENFFPDEPISRLSKDFETMGMQCSNVLDLLG